MSVNFLTCDGLKFIIKKFFNYTSWSISIYKKQYNATFLLERSVAFMSEIFSTCDDLKFNVKEFSRYPIWSLSEYEKEQDSTFFQ
jgi:hypothetical protein